MTTTRETVNAWLEAREHRNLELLADLTAPDAQWESPVAGTVEGRDAVVGQIEAAYADTERFTTSLHALECRGGQAVAVIRNRGTRDDAELDSLQTLFLRVEGGLVTEVKVAVDDEDAVEAFWDDPSVGGV